MTKDIVKRIRDKKIVQAYREGNLTTKLIAHSFKVSVRTVQKVVKVAGAKR